MDNTITLDQTVPISTLPRDYMSIIAKSEEKNKPVVLLRHGKSVGAIISNKLLASYAKLKKMYEEEKLLRIVGEAEREYKDGKTVTIKADDIGAMRRLIGL